MTNTFSAWEYWPEGADLQQPATWAEGQIVIADLGGRIIQEFGIEENSIRQLVNHDLPPGLYYISLKDVKGIALQKLIVY